MKGEEGRDEPKAVEAAPDSGLWTNEGISLLLWLLLPTAGNTLRGTLRCALK